MSDLTPQQRQDAKNILEGRTPGQSACQHCGGVHLRACRRVRRAEWHPDGTLLKVWYWKDGEWDESEILWPEDAYDDDSQTGEPG